MEYAHPGWKPSLNSTLIGAMVLDPKSSDVFGDTNPIRAVREPPLPFAGQGQGEDQTGQGQYGYDEHREGEAGVIRDET